MSTTAEKMVKIKIPLTRTEQDDVFVGYNGRAYLIKRGVEVEVPEGVVEIIEESEKRTALAIEAENETARPSKD
jgi:hypothetical protein